LDVSLEQVIIENVGRIIINSVPTGVSVAEAMHHGGPYPASSDARFTAVGPDSILRLPKKSVGKNTIRNKNHKKQHYLLYF